VNIYVANLAYDVTEADLRAAFVAFGTVQSVRIVYDHDTGRSRGFGFVGMADADAQAAISALSQAELHGRKLRLGEAEKKNQR